MKRRSPQPKADPRRARQLRRPCCVETVSVAEGMDGVFGDGTAGSWSDVNQGSRAGNNDGVHDLAPAGSEEPYPEGDRALVVAKKRGNARGAKGGREVECDCDEEEVKNWRSAERLCAPDAEKPPFPKEQLAASEPQGVTRRPSCSGVSPFGGLQTTILESRMREIRLSGLGGGVEDNTSTPTSYSAQGCRLRLPWEIVPRIPYAESVESPEVHDTL
jgi:hypothetical protein